MAKEFLTSPDFKAPILLSGSAGTSGQQITSQGPGLPPVWGAPGGGGGGGGGGGSGGGGSFAGYAVGNYVIPTTGGLAVGQAVSANQIALMPFMVQRAITTSELAVRVTTAGAGVDFQLAIYGSDSGLPSGTPVISTTNLSGGTAGLVQATVTATTFQPGLLYWQAVSASGTLTFLSVAANNSYHSSIIGSTALSEMLAATGTNFHCRLITGQTVGTWPDLTGVSFVAPSSSQRRVPVFAFLISALP